MVSSPITIPGKSLERVLKEMTTNPTQKSILFID
jgi:hypothetical protein